MSGHREYDISSDAGVFVKFGIHKIYTCRNFICVQYFSLCVKHYSSCVLLCVKIFRAGECN